MNKKAFVAIITIYSMFFALNTPLMAALGQQDAAPRGTVFTVKLTKAIGSDRSQPGDTVEAVLDEPLTSGGRVIFPAGSQVIGTVNEVSTPRGGQSNGSINFAFNRLITPDGREASIVANLEGYSEYHEDSWRKRILTLAIAVGAGAIISKIFGGSLMRGVLIGGAAGTGYVLYRDGEHIVLEEGTTINLVLEEAVTVNYATGDQPPAENRIDDQPLSTPLREAPAGEAEHRGQAEVGERSVISASGNLANGPDSRVIFTDGNIEQGTFSGVTPDGKLVINKEYGQLSIPTNKIQEIVFVESVNADVQAGSDTVILLNGNALSGFFGGFSSGKVVLNSDYGELRIPVRDVARIKFMQR